MIGWLERGECSKRNACKFHAMIHSTFMHAKKLAGEKKAEDEELAKIKETYRIKTEQFLMSSESLFFYNLT